MRKFLFGLCGFAALGLGALSVQPAAAQPYYPGFNSYERPGVEFRAGPVTVQQIHDRRPRRAYRRHWERRPYGYYRRPAWAGPRCVVRVREVWNGYRWVERRVRRCRY